MSRKLKAGDKIVCKRRGLFLFEQGDVCVIAEVEHYNVDDKHTVVGSVEIHSDFGRSFVTGYDYGKFFRRLIG